MSTATALPDEDRSGLEDVHKSFLGQYTKRFVDLQSEKTDVTTWRTFWQLIKVAWTDEFGWTAADDAKGTKGNPSTMDVSTSHLPPNNAPPPTDR